MISSCSSPPLEPPEIPAPQDLMIPPPQHPSLPDSAFPLPPSSLQAPAPPPPPLPPPAPALGAAPPHVFGLEKSRLLKEALEKAGPVPSCREDVKRLLKLHKDRCGLVALWMAGPLLLPPDGVPLERIVQVALERGYTAQGEMFSAADMGRLAQEVLGCHAELLCGGLGSPNRDRVLRHLVAGHPLLIPYPGTREGVDGEGRRPGSPRNASYDEDFNHEPCQRRGHKAHWAVSAGGCCPRALIRLSPAPSSRSHCPALRKQGVQLSQPAPTHPHSTWHSPAWKAAGASESPSQGVLLGVPGVPSLGYAEDPELPGLFHPVPSTARRPPLLPEEGSPGAAYLLSKQGKSWHYQLWDYDQVRDSNLQLTDFSPARAADGREYVVPAGGVRAGLCGQVLLLTPPTQATA
ncbi:UPF0692 protein C19orf54 [Galemys pyrenaicus]|uniref:Actin maturation protease n=1 Tax=Galemys pyrenaicus TaxID=202257 RepID=A0A8J6A2U4_GALPY|nr:UPF0692 protein C19orf54 [Galemys pyrenaicus]